MDIAITILLLFVAAALWLAGLVMMYARPTVAFLLAVFGAALIVIALD